MIGKHVVIQQFIVDRYMDHRTIISTSQYNHCIKKSPLLSDLTTEQDIYFVQCHRTNEQQNVF